MNHDEISINSFQVISFSFATHSFTLLINSCLLFTSSSFYHHQLKSFTVNLIFSTVFIKEVCWERAFSQTLITSSPQPSTIVMVILSHQVTRWPFWMDWAIDIQSVEVKADNQVIETVEWSYANSVLFCRYVLIFYKLLLHFTNRKVYRIA